MNIVKVKRNQFRDSLYLMKLSDEVSHWENVEQAIIVMGTENNKKILNQLNLGNEVINEATGSDMVIAIEMSSGACQEEADVISAKLEERLNQSPGDNKDQHVSFDGALETRPDINLVVVSVPGQHATELIRKSINSGKDVFCFSQHVPIENELALKQEAVKEGVLLMGPDCGTSILNGYGIGFANSVFSGNIGLISASGSGLQEVVSLIAKSGGGISQAIGLGGNDMREPINGLSAIEAIKRLKGDPQTEVVVIIAKSASAQAVSRVVREAKTAGLPIIADFGAIDELASDDLQGVHLVDSYEECAKQAVLLSGGTWRINDREQDFNEWLKTRQELCSANHSSVRGLFAGGSLCGEALSICSKGGLNVKTNLDYFDSNSVSDSVFLDLGAEEYTEGRPHPFIDHRLRSLEIKKAFKEQISLILMDVVIGWGSHPDPAGEVARAIHEAEHEFGKGTAVITSICGTDDDYQNYAEQYEKLTAQGVFVAESNAAAAHYALRFIDEMRGHQNGR